MRPRGGRWWSGWPCRSCAAALRLPPPVVTAAAAAAPLALCVAVPRSARATSRSCALQMWAYVATYEMPNDDPERAARAGARRLPGAHRPRARARRAAGRCACSARFARPRASRCGPPSRCSCGAHWLWFLVPARDRRLHAGAPPRAVPARRGADLRGLRPRPHRLLGASRPRRRGTPPRQGVLGPRTARRVRRMMVEHGEAFWKDALGPSLQCAGRQPARRHAVPALRDLRDGRARPVATPGRSQGAIGWTYALTLGFALVYLGEHYVVDLLAGAGADRGRPPRRAARRAGAARGEPRRVQALEARAHA